MDVGEGVGVGVGLGVELDCNVNDQTLLQLLHISDESFALTLQYQIPVFRTGV